MKNETVEVTIQVPKGIDLFIRRMAALDDSTPEEWYEQFVRVEFDAIRDNNFIFEYWDADKMKQLYQYEH
jgi:hypothetical protein